MMPKDCPINKPRKRRSRKNLEAPVIKECLNFLLKYPDVIYVERRNTGAVQFQDGGFLRFGQKGATDIWCLVRCRHLKRYSTWWECTENIDGSCVGSCHTHVEIECKRADGKGRQSEAQKKFQEFCEGHAIPYILTTSANQLAEKIQAIGLDS